MKPFAKPFAVLAATLLLIASPALAQQKVKLSTLDWCPYVCAGIADGGFSSVVVREAFKAVGYELEYEILPWQRAVASATDSAAVAGYFPEYSGPEYSSAVAGFTLSPAIGEGPLMLMHGTSVAVPDATLDTLKALAPLGVVTGYLQTSEIDRAVADGSLAVEGVASDELLIRKVAAGRNKAATIDRYVAAHLLRRADMAAMRGQVAFHEKPLENKTLHVAFNTSAHGARMAALFAEGLGKIDVATMQKRYFSMVAATAR